MTLLLSAKAINLKNNPLTAEITMTLLLSAKAINLKNIPLTIVGFLCEKKSYKSLILGHQNYKVEVGQVQP